MFYKCWASDKCWLPNEEGGLKVLSGIPTGRLHLLQPDYKECLDVEDLARQVEKCRVKFNIGQRGWWIEYLPTEQEIQDLWSSTSNEQLLEMGRERWFLSILSLYNNHHLREDTMRGLIPMIALEREAHFEEMQ